MTCSQVELSVARMENTSKLTLFENEKVLNALRKVKSKKATSPMGSRKSPDLPESAVFYGLLQPPLAEEREWKHRLVLIEKQKKESDQHHPAKY